MVSIRRSTERLTPGRKTPAGHPFRAGHPHTHVSPSDRTRVLIADDHPLVRHALRDLVSDTPDLVYDGGVGSFTELWERLRLGEPNVLLLDLRMPGGSELEAVERLHKRHPRIGVLILSGYPEEHYLVTMMRAGAAGYLQKSVDPSSILEAIRVIARGGVYVSEAGGRALARAARPGAPTHSVESLSKREFEVMQFLASGLTVGEIAGRLHLSAKTVSTYRSRLMLKMGFSSTADIVRYAHTRGLAE